jgi:hypothetical protein
MLPQAFELPQGYTEEREQNGTGAWSQTGEAPRAGPSRLRDSLLRLP